MTTEMARARGCVQALYRLGARRVWICGSIARAGRWDERSDVDLAVEGLPPQHLAQACGILSRLAGRTVHVVPLEDAHPSLRAQIVACRILVDPDGRDHGAHATAAPAPAPTGSAPVALGRWHERRLATVAGLLSEARARRIVDYGCGTGRLIEMLALAGAERVTGVDRDAETLERARIRLRATLRPAVYQRITLQHGLLSHWGETMAGHDAAVAVEVIEHLDPPDLAGFAAMVFGRLRPALVVLTTPNAEFNAAMKTVDLRHPEHRFEWTRAQFRAWSSEVARAHGYSAVVRPLGRSYAGYGPVTQLAVFKSADTTRV
jgi:predicted nucleotidyltransferase